MDLPKDLELPLQSGAPWWYWLGGRPALDFVNTRRERWLRDVEALVTPSDLAGWLTQAELIAQPPTVTPSLLLAAHELREAIDASVQAHLRAGAVPQPAIVVIDRWLPLAQLPPHLALDDLGTPALGRATPDDPARHALGLIAYDAAEMLGTEQRGRLRVCASDTCSARFYDRSRSGQRRWCSMQGCGNVAKARRHRVRSSTPGSHRSR
ncbi:MAG: ABATE domain-containing protein [Actinomycetota bacterium]|nr:ABATE domain-containing protein [Actinomycetota bacterium]